MLRSTDALVSIVLLLPQCAERGTMQFVASRDLISHDADHDAGRGIEV